MMQNRYNIFRDVAVTNNPEGDDVSGKDYIVEWGQRGRIGEPALFSRIEFVVNRVLSELDQDYLENLPTPIMMTPGLNWIDNIMLNTANISGQSKGNKIEKGKKEMDFVSEEYLYMTKKLPKH